VPAVPAAHEVEAAEQKRWMTWFGLPALIAAFFVGLVFATGQELWLGFAAAAIVADIGVLVWLAMSSDTNDLIFENSAAPH
jgi:membrane protein implicated in regulation of membrane protease activity